MAQCVIPTTRRVLGQRVLLLGVAARDIVAALRFGPRLSNVMLMDFVQDLDGQLRALAGAGGFRGAVRVESEGAALLDAACGRDGASRDLEPGMAFQIASVSKTFAAACMLSLMDRGRLSLDDPVIRWVGVLPTSWSAMTVRHLLTHTSGSSH
jgi:CubicO group peptidase (beta-lactamase class C family)